MTTFFIPHLIKKNHYHKDYNYFLLSFSVNFITFNYKFNFNMILMASLIDKHSLI